MKTKYIDISCDGPTPDPLDVSSGDRVEFDNTTGKSVTITFTNPGIFNPSPGGSITIAKDDSKTLTVGRTKCDTDYSYPDCEKSLATRNGRINVG